MCFAPPQKREKAPLHESHEKALPVPSLTNEARFLTLRSMPASWPLTSIHLGLSFIGSEDKSSNSATLAREVTPSGGRYRFESLEHGVSSFTAELPVDRDGLVLEPPGRFRRTGWQ